MIKIKLAVKLVSGQWVFFSRPGGLSGVLTGHVMLGITEVGELKNVPQRSDVTNETLRLLVETKAAEDGVAAKSSFRAPRSFDIVDIK